MGCGFVRRGARGRRGRRGGAPGRPPPRRPADRHGHRPGRHGERPRGRAARRLTALDACPLRPGGADADAATGALAPPQPRTDQDATLALWHAWRATRDPALRDRLVLGFAPMVKWIAYRQGPRAARLVRHGRLHLGRPGGDPALAGPLRPGQGRDARAVPVDAGPRRRPGRAAQARLGAALGPPRPARRRRRRRPVHRDPRPAPHPRGARRRDRHDGRGAARAARRRRAGPRSGR